MSSVVLATAGYDHTIRFWEATTGVCYRTIPFQESQVNKLEISADKVFLAAAGNPVIKIFDVPSQSNQPISTFEGHTGNVTSIGFQKDKRWMYSGAQLFYVPKIMFHCANIFSPIIKMGLCKVATPKARNGTRDAAYP